MPIIYVKGGVVNDGRKHTKILRSSSSEDLLKPSKSLYLTENEKGSKYQKNSYVLSAEDMNDLFDLKVIKVTAPSGYEAAQTIVVGEDLYFARDDSISKKLAETVNGTKSDQTTEKVVVQATLLQKIRYRQANNQHNSTMGVSKELKERIAESNFRAKYTSAGNSITSVKKKPSVDGTISWALQYIARYEDSIAQELLDLSEEMEYVIEEQKRSELAKQNGEKISKSTRRASSISPPKSSRSPPRSLKVEALKAGSLKGVRDLGVPGAAPGGKTQSLSQRLDKLSHDLTADFMHALAAQQRQEQMKLMRSSVASIRSTNSGTSKHSSLMLPSQPSSKARSSNGVLGAAHRSHRKISGHEKDHVVGVAGSSVTEVTEEERGMLRGKESERGAEKLGPLLEAPHTDGVDDEGAEAEGGVQGGRGRHNIEETVVEVKLHEPVVDAVISPSRKGDGGRDGENNSIVVGSSVVLPTTTSDDVASTMESIAVTDDDGGSLKADKVRFKGRGQGLPILNVVAGHTAAIDSSALGTGSPKREKARSPHRPKPHDDWDQMKAPKASSRPVRYGNSLLDEADTKLKPDVMGEFRQMKQQFERRMATSMEEFKSRTEKITTLQQVAIKQTVRAKSTAGRVFQQWLQFQQIREHSKEAIAFTCEEMDFNRPQVFDAKLECFPMTSAHGGDVVTDLRRMNARAFQKQHNDAIQRLIDSSWFFGVLCKLREASKKGGLGRTVPLCLFKFMVLCKFLLMVGFAMTTESFYVILEKTVTHKDDHRRVIVHKTLKACRESIGIGPEPFMKYLEDNDISACPELITQIRNLKRKRARKLKINLIKKNKLHIIQEHNKSHVSLHPDSPRPVPPALLTPAPQQTVGFDFVPTSLADVPTMLRMPSNFSRRSGSKDGGGVSSRRSSFSEAASELGTDNEGTGYSENGSNWDESDKDEVMSEFDF